MQKELIFKSNSNYRQGMIRTLCFVFFTWLLAVIMGVLFQWEDFYELGRLFELKAVLLCYTIITVIVLVYEIREALLNERTVTINKDGITIKLLRKKHYTWSEIHTVSIEIPNNVKINESFSKKYSGKVVILSKSAKKRIKYWHPFAMNKLLFIDMICIFLDKIMLRSVKSFLGIMC